MMDAMRRALLLAVSLAIVTPLAFYAKRGYHGPAWHWARDSFGGALYEIFWCLLIALVLPRVRPVRIALVVLIATCILEFLQLWHPPFLELARSYFIGRTILGSSFDWMDFPYYFAGSFLGYWWLRALTLRTR